MSENKIAMPPLIDRIEGGVTHWKRYEDVDFEIVGVFLSCHLVIEHYVEEFIRAYSPASFGWDGAGLTFGQKISLIAGLKNFQEPYTIPSVLKHFNSLRNKLSHDVRFVLTGEVLLPEVQFLKKVTAADIDLNFSDTKLVLQEFTSMVCVYFAAIITHCSEQKHKGLNGVWKL
ncbi:hypothetical protein ACM792_14455 [Metapseudomonas otitidis]|uniref:hypothetical protein n=1 Tax=Metapseudomonas otitidis TaxID=319939 RepID=UPI0039FCBEB8